MLSFQFLTLVLATAAAAAAITPSADASSETANVEAIISYEDYGAEIASAGADQLQARGKERICDLTMCTGVGFTGDCSRWCYYESEYQVVPSAQRASTASVKFQKARECRFFMAPACDQHFITHGPSQWFVYPGGNVGAGMKGQAGCVICSMGSTWKE